MESRARGITFVRFCLRVRKGSGNVGRASSVREIGWAEMLGRDSPRGRVSPPGAGTGLQRTNIPNAGAAGGGDESRFGGSKRK